ncbi:iron-containing redox enzyme family protein [Photobacterium sp. R1]
MSIQSYDEIQSKFDILSVLHHEEETVGKLNKLTSILDNLSEKQIEEEILKLKQKMHNSSGFTKRIIEHTTSLHQEYVSLVNQLSLSGKVNTESLSNYFIQGWYHTSYTTRFEHMFTALLNEEKLQDTNSHGNKFTKLIEHGIDEEEGHELWALQDIISLGVKNDIDPLYDVFPETKAIVWSQHDRLTRLPAIGFLGYSFYLELLIATESYGLLNVLNKCLNTTPKDHKFIYYHYLVDQGHAIDNIELFDRIVHTEKDFNEIIDNMNFIHTMYYRLTEKSFQS